MATPTDADGMRSPRNSHVAGVSDLVRELKSGTVDTSDVMIEDDDFFYDDPESEEMAV